jgi:YegS/Rv2252/BmrU family lipid kinase
MAPHGKIEARTLVVVNRKSTGAGADLTPALDGLARDGIEPLLEAFDAPDAMAERIRTCDDDIDRIVVGGGDGTMASVAEGLRERGLPVGILPLGNACDLARSLGIPRNLVQAAEVVSQGRIQAVDLGYVNGLPFFNMASLGLSVQVARRLTGQAKRRWGVLSYPMLIWDAYRATRPFHADIACDGETRRLLAIQLGIGSGRFYGGGMTVAEDAWLDDGLLHVYAIEPLGWLKLLQLLPRLWTGRHRSVEQLTIMTGSRFDVTTSSRRSVNADGEIVTRTPATFEIAPGAIRVFVPKDADVPGLSP